MSDTAKYKYTVEKKNGFKATTSGTLSSPGQHGTVLAALDGELSENSNLLRTAPKLLELAIPIRDILGGAEWACPEHAEDILKSLIDQFHRPLSIAVDASKATE